MTLRVDPEHNEIHALKSVANWRGKEVLEVGCGDGRLTQRLAGLGANILAIDPDPGHIRTARKNLPKRYAGQIRYQVGKAEQLKQPAGTYDLVVFSWVL
jgi:2-polyprenyl-6-hydroxyphenyl methylase / 3-demethylubiquinone-9 3-methyltransferase